VLREYPGINDREVLQLAAEKEALLLTEDSDFGEWIFVHKKQNFGVIFLRYRVETLENVIETLRKVLEKYGRKLQYQFTVVTINRIRMRNSDLE